MNPLPIYIGYDAREDLAYRVAEFSLRRRTAGPVTVTPLDRTGGGVVDRPVETRNGRLWCPLSEAPMATEFAISRFAVPFLQAHGWALFTDCDVLFRDDVRKLFLFADPRYAVMVVKHQQAYGGSEKMDGQIQTHYARKNWSSVVLWNTSHPAHRDLSRQALNTWPGRDLHAFKWLPDELIGELPAFWNHLVDVDPAPPQAVPRLLHYTLGGPWFEGYRNCGYATEWQEERRRMEATAVLNGRR